MYKCRWQWDIIADSKLYSCINSNILSPHIFGWWGVNESLFICFVAKLYEKLSETNLRLSTSVESVLFIRLKILNSLKRQHNPNLLELYYIVRYRECVNDACCFVYKMCLYICWLTHTPHIDILQVGRWRWHLDWSKQSHSCLTVVCVCDCDRKMLFCQPLVNGKMYTDWKKVLIIIKSFSTLHSHTN